MEQITKFKAVDGQEFSTERECLSYEGLIKKVNSIMASLNPLPEDSDCDFSNGYCFVQQSKESFQIVKMKLLDEVKKYIKHKWVQQTMDDDSVHLSYVGRLIDDYNNRPLNRAWNRLMCIDKDFREWGQPYFANNPEKSPALQNNSQP